MEASRLTLGLLTIMAPFGNICVWRTTLVKIEVRAKITVKIEKYHMFDLFQHDEEVESDFHLVLFN